MLYTADDYLFVVSVEDRPSMLWQLELLAYTFTFSTSPQNIVAVIATGDEPLSAYAEGIQEEYGIQVIKAGNYGRTKKLPIYTNKGIIEKTYPIFNKVCALGEVYSRGLHNNYKYVVTLDPDMFAFGSLDFNMFPTLTTAIAGNRIMTNALESFCEGDWQSQVWRKGVALGKLLESTHVPQNQIDSFSFGSVIVFFKKEDFTEDVVNDCIMYTEVVHHLLKISGDFAWEADMPSYSLSLAKNNISTVTLDNPQFNFDNMNEEIEGEPIPLGSIVHYTWDSWYSARGTRQFWNKRDYHGAIFDCIEDLEHRYDAAEYRQSKDFFGCCLEIAKNIHIDRSC